MDDLAGYLAQTAEALALLLPERAAERVERYVELLTVANTHQNLVGDTCLEAVRQHLADALLIAVALRQPGEPSRVADLGSGAGLPGLVLAIVMPTWQVTLIEALQRRAAFLLETARRLKLSNVTIEPARAEEAGRNEEHRGQYDRVTARRVAELRVLLEYGCPLLAPGGYSVYPKGAGLENELAAAAGVPAMLGAGEPSLTAVPAPPDWPATERSFVVLPQLAPCPERYPRRPGMPAKRPLRGAGA
ncbi:MAG: 16S rRNA (guanine(527)-N(7))-methyltransferase RsmG [Fimbriimonadaceae bacterium]|nr:16S rRNA (guanine(527)-N(7))-methyltransferase RsmG [Fimbriimonadaceae bacterium]